jgi:carbamoyl-phosphate synthase large subunit
MRDITVLITASGVQFMLGLVSCFRKNGERNIRIVGVDINEDPSIKLMVDQFYLVPRVSDDNYVDSLIEICKKEKVDVLIPFMSAELPYLLSRKSEFKNIGTKVSISESDSLLIANNKLKLYQFMADNNLPVPKFYQITHASELEEVCCLLGYPQKPVCVKVTESSGSRGVRIIDAGKSRYDLFINDKPSSFYISLKEMTEILSEKNQLPEMIVMEYLPGIEYTVDLLADKGKVLYIVGKRNNVSLMSIAQESTLTEEPSAYKLCTEIVRLMNLDGNIGFDFLYDAKGIPILMDINPRITATISLCAAGGLNLPYLRIKQLLGEELPEVEINYGITMKRRYLEMFTDNDGNEVLW